MNNGDGDGDGDNDDSNYRLVLLGLAMSQAGSPKGDRPDLAELWDFLHNAVSDGRRDEILSHLAEDAELFSEWQSLVDTTAEIEQAQINDTVPPAPEKPERPASAIGQRLKEWIFLRPWLAAGGAVAAVALLVFGTLGQTPTTSDDFWQAWSQPISSQSTLQDPALRDDLDALLAGVRSQLIALSYPGTGPSERALPDDIPVCQDDDEMCIERRSALFSLGELAINQLEQCQVDTAVQRPSLSDLQRISAIVQSHPPLAVLATPVNRWVQAIEQDTTAACDAAALVISGALPVD